MRFTYLSVGFALVLALAPSSVMAQQTQRLSGGAMNAAAQQSPASLTRQRSMGRTLGGLALVTAGALIPFNWGSQCPAGQDRSYLGYDCYADAEKQVTAAMRRNRNRDHRTTPPRVVRTLLPEAQEPCRVHTTPISLKIPTRRRYGIRP